MTFNIIEETATRLDNYLAAETQLTRSRLQKYIGEGHVLVNGLVRPKRYLLKPGDTVKFSIPEPEPSEVLPENIPLDIVYEDSDLIVVNKPRGMVVHISPGHTSGTLVNALLWHCELSGINGILRPGIVHRLDKDTSGLIAAAKNDTAHIGLARQLAERSMVRIYHAIVTGLVKDDSFTVDTNIARHGKDRKKQAVYPKGAKGRNAVTHVRVLARFRKHTLIEAALETGRTHQIRVHMAHIGHSVIGDELYGTGSAGRTGRTDRTGRAGGQFLHAKRLEFLHPVSGTGMRFDSKWPDYFAEKYMKLASVFGIMTKKQKELFV